ncbi:MAG: amidohydrolase family protein [Acidobacteria bacterium]|nr:amidohydrolase family protein [Acidobacteriota bacterium]
MHRRMNQWMTGAAVAAVALVLAARPDAQTGGATAFVGARVVVGDGTAPIENATVVVRNGQIAEVGPSTRVRVPAGATRVDVAGKTIMPTIVDTHVHLGTTRDALMKDLRDRAYFGVSAALSMGLDPAGDPFAVRAEAPAGVARYFLAGRGLTMPEPGRSDVPYWVTTEAEARKAVQAQAALKVDLIKIWVDDRDGKYKKMPPEIYTPVIDEAHKATLRVAAHIFNRSDAKGLLKAGIDAFAHGIRDVDADDEVVALVKARKNVVLIPNMPDRGVVADYAWLKGSLADAEVAKIQAGATNRPPAQAAWGIQARNLKKLSDAGMTVAVGTDGNTAWAPHVEMADMVAAGMTPMQVIAAATKNGAAFLRMADTGTIAAGKNADLLVLDGNPVEDITHTRKIAAVYLKGVKVDREALRPSR